MEYTEMALVQLEKLISQLMKAKRKKEITLEMKKNLDINLEICRKQLIIIEKKKEGKYIASW